MISRELFGIGKQDLPRVASPANMIPIPVLSTVSSVQKDMIRLIFVIDVGLTTIDGRVVDQLLAKDTYSFV